MMTFAELYRRAQSVLNPRQLSESAEAGGVGAALLTASGNVYLGVVFEGFIGGALQEGGE